ncbi:hypothetical protein HMI56_003152 [Coelomomyces lativittatus]|nr:hypothetical protein HMI56_003152 [Coelomomyces lativittatus]
MHPSCSESSSPVAFISPKLWIEKVIFTLLSWNPHQPQTTLTPPPAMFLSLKNPSLSKKRPPPVLKPNDVIMDDEMNPDASSSLGMQSNHDLSFLSFVPCTKRSSKTCAMYLRVLDLLHENLTLGQITTIRDLYYHDVCLFQSQQVVNKLVMNIAHAYGTSRECFNVKASPKGLACGSTTYLMFSNGTTVSMTSSSGVSTVISTLHERECQVILPPLFHFFFFFK